MDFFIVGVTSYVVGSCGSLGVVDGFARVTYQMDWIRENSDNYVKFCSAKIAPQNICSGKENCKKEHEICLNGQCRCKLGYSEVSGICVDECILMKESNLCSKGLFKVYLKVAKYHKLFSNSSLLKKNSTKSINFPLNRYSFTCICLSILILIKTSTSYIVEKQTNK